MVDIINYLKMVDDVNHNFANRSQLLCGGGQVLTGERSQVLENAGLFNAIHIIENVFLIAEILVVRQVGHGG